MAFGRDGARRRAGARPAGVRGVWQGRAGRGGAGGACGCTRAAADATSSSKNAERKHGVQASREHSGEGCVGHSLYPRARGDRAGGLQVCPAGVAAVTMQRGNRGAALSDYWLRGACARGGGGGGGGRAAAASSSGNGSGGEQRQRRRQGEQPCPAHLRGIGVSIEHQVDQAHCVSEGCVWAGQLARHLAAALHAKQAHAGCSTTRGWGEGRHIFGRDGRQGRVGRRWVQSDWPGRAAA